MKAKWLVLFWMFADACFGLTHTACLASTNGSGGIDYTKSQLTPTIEQGEKIN
ncbi:hypothetical protein [Fictibacillus arsenicus]|uniref:hypothetical protein n=1 Tax=Fictibacillus arsenicus TaxID=255247 RepID=UPI0015C53D9A|nr:hypothetical protein [Fictibacillus arsenicus]